MCTLIHFIHSYTHSLRLLYIFYFAIIHEKGVPLFEGTFQYERYFKIFHDIMEENEDDFLAIGTYYCQKLVVTMGASVWTVLLNIVLICIWCVWSMGGVKDSYLKYESAGYKYVGQCITGKYQLFKIFALSPAYFYFPILMTWISV